MNNRRNQTGITLVVSLIMLVVLTLLVVSGIRFGNINLKIAGNAQTEIEAAAATQRAIETMTQQVLTVEKVDTVAAQPAMSVSMGGATYSVYAKKPACVFSRNIFTPELDPEKASDAPCFEGVDTDGPLDSNGKPIAKPTACKAQQWDVAAALTDTANTGAKVSMLQGVSLRVPAEVLCP